MLAFADHHQPLCSSKFAVGDFVEHTGQDLRVEEYVDSFANIDMGMGATREASGIVRR